MMEKMERVQVQLETNQIPDAKYYDLYEVEDIATVCEGTCYGHALSETSGWYNDDATFVSSSYPWLYRGGHYNGTSNPGVFAFSYNDGFSTSHNSSRAVLISF